MKNMIFNSFFGKILEQMAKHPEKITEKQERMLEKWYHDLCKAHGISEGAKWCVDWKVKKFFDEETFAKGVPYETCLSKANVVLDVGANTILKLIGGISGAVAFSNANAQIGVGTDVTPENAAQTGLQATGSNVYYKGMEGGYPIVNGRSITFKANYGSSEANFPWNEFAVVNGTGVGGISLNRKVENLGTKATGIWSLEVTISVTSNT